MVIDLRFYAGLNDFLREEWRMRSFSLELQEGVTAGEVITKLGVPLEQVELLLVDGRVVDCNHPLENCVRMTVYPHFEVFDLKPN